MGSLFDYTKNFEIHLAAKTNNLATVRTGHSKMSYFMDNSEDAFTYTFPAHYFSSCLKVATPGEKT